MRSGRFSLGRKLFAFWPAALLPMTVLFGGCATQAQLENSTFVVELGEDVYGNASLYIKDPQKWATDRMRIEPQSAGISVIDNRFVSSSLSYLGVGEYDFVLVQDGAKTPFVIKVKDTQAPISKVSPERISVPYLSTIRWDEVYQASDLSGVYYDAPLNLTAQPGEHAVQVRIRDRFGNSVLKDLIVEVTP